MIPAMVEIAHDVAGLAPNSCFFNYANPMSVICWAARQATEANIVGLCIGVHHVRQELADFIGAPREEVACQAVGVNHFTWVFDLRWNGRDAWPLVREKLAAEKARGSQPVGTDETLAPGGDTTMVPESRAPRHGRNPFSWSLFEAYGAYPAVNDRHVSEFFPERFPNGAYYGKKLGVDVFSLEAVIAYGDAIYEQMRAQASGEAPLNQGIFERALGEHSQLLEILDAIERDARRTYSANLPNRGAVPNLPGHAILEMTSAATGRGMQPLAVPDFPAILAAPLVRKIAGHEVTVEAALTGSRALFEEALLIDGCVTARETAAKLAGELLAAHREYLPQFA
jgi:alpha-galactosidase